MLVDYQCGFCNYIDYDVIVTDPLDMQLSYRCPRCTEGFMVRLLGKPNFVVNGYNSKNNYTGVKSDAGGSTDA